MDWSACLTVKLVLQIWLGFGDRNSVYGDLFGIDGSFLTTQWKFQPNPMVIARNAQVQFALLAYIFASELAEIFAIHSNHSEFFPKP